MKLRALTALTALTGGSFALATTADAATPACSVVEQVTSTTGGQTSSAVTDTDGDRVAFRSNRDLTGDNPDLSFEIFLADLTADTLTQISDLAAGQFAIEPSISDNGTRVAFVSASNELGTNADLGDEIFVYDSTGPTLTQRTSAAVDSVSSGNPSISGNGAVVAFNSSANLTGANADGNTELFRVNAAGPPTVTQLTSSAAGEVGAPSTNQTGNRIAFASSENLVPATGNADGNAEIFVIDPGGPTTLQLTTTTGAGNNSPDTDDGSRVVFTSQQNFTGQNGDGSIELFARVVTGGFFQLTQTVGGTAAPRINPAGDRMAFGSGSPDLPGSSTSPDIYVSDLTPSGISAVTDVPVGRSAGSPSISDDGEVIAFGSSGDPLGSNPDNNAEIFVARCGPRTQLFTDVPPANSFFGAIQWMSELGIANGFPGPTFRPADGVKRQQMANFLYNLAGQPAFTPPVTPTFVDVPATNPFYVQIEWMTAEGIASGFPGGRFKPADAVKRQQMANFLYNLAGQPLFAPPGTPTFVDVPSSNPFFVQIEWMAAEGVASGFPGGLFKPADVVKRQQMANFMHNFAVFVGVNLD